MKITKILSLLLVFIMIVSAVSCGNSTTQTTEAATNAPTEAPTNKPTEAPTNEPTEAPTNEPTEAPTNEPTEAPTNEPTETTTEEKTEETTEAPPPEYDFITIAEALELCGEPGNITEVRYYIKATVKTITNPTYGQMVITDETGEITVYGTYGVDDTYYSDLAEKPYKGDTVILYCILQNYNGTKEVKHAQLISFVSNQGDVDLSQYTDATIADARNAAEGAKLKVSGVVAKITYANGMKPNGFMLVNGADSIYVFDGDTAARVKVGNRIEIAASKTYWILDTESANANKHGYTGCNQLENVTLISNDEGNNDWMSASFPTSTVKDILDTPVSEDITTQIYKVTAIVNKVPGTGFVNYYINDLDETTGSYTYTQCNGNDFAWLDEFDGKICTVYLVALNAKSTVSGCIFRFLPVAVVDEGFTFDTTKAAEHAVKYYGIPQFAANYTGDPSLEVVSDVSSTLLGFEGAALSYTSSDNSVVSFTTENGKTIMHCYKSGTVTITVEGSYNGTTYSATTTVNVDIAVEEIPSITVGEAIDSNVGDIITVKGIVGPSLVNQSGFYLIDESGVIAVVMDSDELAKVQLGNEVIIRGTRAIRLKEGSSGFGQTNIDACEVVVNNYGSYEYSTASFITDKTVADFYALDYNEDHGAKVYVFKGTIKVVEAQYYSNIYVTDGTKDILLYCSNANQYSWLKVYAGQEVTVEIAPCNWNSKNSYRGCVLAVITESGEKICNELNFTK